MSDFEYNPTRASRRSASSKRPASSRRPSRDGGSLESGMPDYLSSQGDDGSDDLGLEYGISRTRTSRRSDRKSKDKGSSGSSDGDRSNRLRTKPESDTGSKRTRSGAEPAKTGGISRFLDRISDDNSGSVLSDKERSRTRTVSTDQPQSRADRKASGRSGIEGLRATISGNGNGGVNGSSSLSSNGNNNGNGNGLREKHTLRDQLNKAREATGAKQKKGGPILLLVLLAVIASILVGVVFGGWYMLIRSPGPKVEEGKEVAVIIPEGAGVGVIADILVEKGIVANPNMFKIMTRMKNTGAVYHSGRYLMITGSGYDVAIAMLSKAPDPIETVRVTIIEGLRIDAIARSIADQLGVSAVEFEDRASSAAPDYVEKYPYLVDAYNNSLEGFLFPDTYEFAVDATVDDVIERMLAQFDQVWTSIDVPLDRLEGYNVAQLVTIASLCEREAMLGNERPLVASVIENRLAIDMALQFCSTVQFLLPPERQTAVQLTEAETLIDSPFNTYQNPGLPPGPICSPSKASLEAAARPASTDFMYFVLTGRDGSQTFSRTYEEHIAAQQQSEVF